MAFASSSGDLLPLWLHIDLDVLNQSVMPAVDSSSSSGFDFAQLAELTFGLVASRRILGVNVTIYDPDLDLDGNSARAIVDCLAKGLAPLMKWKGK